MSNPISRQQQGAIQTLTGAANGAYSATAMTIDNAGSFSGALLVDFSLVPAWGSGLAPVSGYIQLFASDYSLDASPVAGPAPSATMQLRLVGTFDPKPLAGNTVLTWVHKLNSVSLTDKTDFYLYNKTLQQILTGWVLKAKIWTPGS